ncbi:MAG: molecular chaperone TorD family protein, partial [Gammaproteobacteria bacterium]|nr:molecular chaperone TorD family protein [Gammaproteobacteria bacterium]
LDDEYHDLFIGIGRGEVIPYGSWYLTGFLMDRPLAVLRGDLAELGFERQQDVKEPEDHIAALCEIMAMLITNEEHDIAVQRRFFQAHIEPWGRTFFQDLQKAKTARFYRAVGQFGEQFVDFEQKYLSLLV